MARPLRIEYAGAWYHVMNRGAARRQIFPNDYLRRFFLDLLETLHETYGVDCHAYCLMGNHYHLLLQTRRANLGRAMQHLDGVYAQRHNWRLATDGPLFRGRYRAQLIERDSYLWCASRYVHRNPLVAGVCQRLADYQWSSYPCFAGLRAPPDWLRTDDTIKHFGAPEHYCAYVEKGDDDDMGLLHADSGRCAPVLGSKSFVAAAMKRTRPDYEVPQSRISPEVLRLDDIINLVSARSGLSVDEIVRPGNKHARRQRAITMMLSQRYCGSTLREIAGAFGIERYTTVASAISRCRVSAAREPGLRRELAQLRSRILELKNA